MQTVASVGGSGTIRSTFDKNARKNVRFPFLFENDGEMLKFSVCWVFFFLLSCVLLLLLHVFPEERKMERENFTPLADCQNE